VEYRYPAAVGLVVLLAVGFVVFWAFLVFVTARALLWPGRRSYAWCVSNRQPDTPGALSPPRAFEGGSIPDPRNLPGELPFWRIAGDAPDGPVVIFSHGWAESRQSVLMRLGALLPVCREVIAWDMPGHGEAPPGRVRLGAGEAAALEDLILLAQGEDLEALEREAARMEAGAEDEADWESFIRRPARPGAPRVVLYGFSLGAGVSLHGAAGSPGRVAGVIAEAPYRMPATPARNVMRAMGFPHRLNLRPVLAAVGFVSDCGPFWRGFDRAEIAAGVGCPVLVLHGTEDAICPVEDGRAIAAAAPAGEIVELEGAGHLTVWLEEGSRERAIEAVRAFVLGLGVAGTGS
jgi:pimeloyl-ACP methyl ester carboxylesterase